MVQVIEMTDIGNGRPSNQDAYLMRQKEYQGETCLLAAVCDGMGGLKRGEIASRYLIEVLKQWFDEVMPNLIKQKNMDLIRKDLIGLIRKSNQNLLLMSEDIDETMGSTLTLLFAFKKRFFVLNVGDSRAYWFDQVKSKSNFVGKHLFQYDRFRYTDMPKCDDRRSHTQR